MGSMERQQRPQGDVAEVIGINDHDLAGAIGQIDVR